MAANRGDKVWVTGAAGQLGSELQAVAGFQTEYEFLFTDLEVDITDAGAVERFVAAQRPDWIVNAAAYTAVDRAETEAARAEELNGIAVGHLARAAEQAGAGLIQISTDYVFDGHLVTGNPLTEQPLDEAHPTNPRSVYGRTKLLGEQYVLAYAKGLVIRTSWLYSTYGNNFLKTMRRLGAERSELGVVADQWGTPTYAADLAGAIVQLITRLEQVEGGYGLYHYSNEGATTWADFAAEIMRLSGLSCRIDPLTTAQYPTAAERPAYSVLSKEKIKRTFDLCIPDWQTSLKRCIAAL